MVEDEGEDLGGLPQVSSKRVVVLAGVMQAFTAAVAVGVTGLLMWLWSSPDRLAGRLGSALGLAEAEISVDGGHRLAGLIVTVPPLVVLFHALWNVSRFFRIFRRGRILTFEAAACVRHFAVGVGILALGRPLMRLLYTGILTDFSVSVSPMIGIGDLLAVLMAAFVFAIGLALDEAARLRDEFDRIL